ncbi:MAG: GMC family oxidoreductase [Caulobacteraceae bacterium]|nr:GMC family oxidoreductase [Caulobacteraceae bacterium]
MTSGDAAWDYVVVGSGAGGGTVAARLAEAGHRVFVVEAGSRPSSAAPDVAHYEVPAFHALASEQPDVTWSFFVEHFADAAEQARDPKRTPHGVFYPRASTLGGCTAHNAMIFMRPHPCDWDDIAALTGDRSWDARRMEKYYRRVEACRYRSLTRLIARFGFNPTGHGWSGWLPVERPMPSGAWLDGPLLASVADSLVGELTGAPDTIASFERFLRRQGDPNDRRSVTEPGILYIPLSTKRHARSGARDRLETIRARRPDRLHIEFDALATRVTIDDHGRAVGVEYLKGERLYRASAASSAVAGEMQQVLANREVILAGGAFNTPQLLMLSGIGPKADLAAVGVATRVDLPGVGRNLQDRYEISVINRMRDDWRSLAGANFEPGDPLYEEWARRRDGMYISNGGAVAFTVASRPGLRAPDLFAMGLLAKFEGYFPGYSRQITAHHDYLTWAILKAHTANRAGVVRLRSSDPRDPPSVNFNYFDAHDDPDQSDLKAVVGAIRSVRKLARPLLDCGLIAEEESPGPAIASDDDLTDYVTANAWGHHACGACAIGSPELGGVLGPDFTVHGVPGLRVVDASVFPRIPGFFIVSAIYMAAEKAADVVLRDIRRGVGR